MQGHNAKAIHGGNQTGLETTDMTGFEGDLTQKGQEDG